MIPQHFPNLLQVTPCPPEKRREALLQLAAAHDPERQAALSAAVKAMYGQPDEQWGGLWVCCQASQLVGAIWVQRLPGDMAQLWLPKTELAKSELAKVDEKQTQVLLKAAHQWAKTQNIRLCYLELSSQESDTESLLLEHGMQRLVCLEYLTGRSHHRLAMKAAMPLALQPFGEFSPTEQLNLLAAVGQDSVDSRALREVLSVKELLAGFYQQDPQAPEHWYVVSYDGLVVGVLLLAPRVELEHWELMLMGLIPDWRGKGLGRSLLNKALELAQQASVPDVILAVDEANLPAKRLYQQAGFVRHGQQRLLAWKGAGERCEAPK